VGIGNSGAGCSLGCESTSASASTTRGSNCEPAQSRSSATACSELTGSRPARGVVIAW